MKIWDRAEVGLMWIGALALMMILGVIVGHYFVPPRSSCKEFHSYGHAERWYSKHPERYQSLDRDQDSIPCEHLINK